MLDSVRDHFDGEPFAAADGLFTRLPVSHDAGEFQNLRDPSAVVFPIDLNRKVHFLMVRQIPHYSCMLRH